MIGLCLARGVTNLKSRACVPGFCSSSYLLYNSCMSCAICGCLWYARLAAMILFWKMVCSGSFAAPDFGWCVVRVSVIERLFRAVSLDCLWIKRTMAVDRASSRFWEKAVVSAE